MNSRPDYRGATEICRGVFIAPLDAVYIVDAEGEVATWNFAEVHDDPLGFTSALTAVALAAAYGPEAVRVNLLDVGETLQQLIKDTADSRTLLESYGGLCPDCGEEMLLDTLPEQSCSFCGHVYYLPQADD